ncbi:MAG: hypothetical protein GY702_14360 [Desulfobulbaceae bacterium]|nr:hypothetical protein [Desulfobulbaceae bacterium]
MDAISGQDRYAVISRKYKEKFGELPPMLFRTGPALTLCLDLMEQAIQGKRGKVSEADFGYPPGSDI